MKKNILSLCILCMLLILICCCCSFFSPQRYVCEVDEVESVQIVRLDKYVEGEYRYEYTILSQIDDYVIFVDRLNELERSVNRGGPIPMEEQHVVIRIDYHNGDYDLIHPDSQWFHKEGQTTSGYFFFDDAQFDALISDYLVEQR